MPNHMLFLTPWHVPLPLCPKVAERMDKPGVISKVSEPTPWCAGMVVVPKKSGGVHICVDLKPLNQSVLRGVHPLPKVDETLAQLEIFSKLDTNVDFGRSPCLSPHNFSQPLSHQRDITASTSSHSAFWVHLSTFSNGWVFTLMGQNKLCYSWWR